MKTNECTHTYMCHWVPHPQAFEQPGKGRVLVVDGGGSKRCALLGDNIAEMAHKNGWSVSRDLGCFLH
jgi:regulator of RNase E activity RraA